MKKIMAAAISLILAVGFVCSFSASGRAEAMTALEARRVIDSHSGQVRERNAKLLTLSPEELGGADFADYDTSGMLVGGELNGMSGADFGEGVYAVSGEKIVRSVQEYGKYPCLFPSNSVLKAAGGKRARVVCGYEDDVPDYQIVKDKENIYVENIDFSDFPVIKFENCSNIIFNGCSFTDFLDNALVFRNCSDISIINCSFKDCGSRMHDETNGGYSIRIVGDEDIKSQNILIEGCKILHSYGKAVSFVGSVDNYLIRNNTIEDTVWGAIDYWYPSVSGEYVNVIENNSCTGIGFGEPSVNNRAAGSCGIGCSAIFAGMGEGMPRSIVKNNVIKNVVEIGIEGPYEVVYRNTIKNTGERSAARVTGSTEAMYIKPSAEYEQRYAQNDIETRGLRCFSSYSAEQDEFKGIYIINNSMKLKKDDATITCRYTRSDIEINCKRLKRLVIADNKGMMTEQPSVNVYMEKGYVMDYFDLDNPCMIGAMPESARYCFNICNGQFK